MAIGAWQDMFKLIYLEEGPVNSNQVHRILYSDGFNEIVMKEVSSPSWDLADSSFQYFMFRE